ncbi:hypothetical protein BG000_007278 [Podila horticola]|nr:hypothetical protein BG000_007278 [Podila horticola]
MHRSTRPADLEETTRTIADALVERFHSGKVTMLASQMPTESMGELPKANPSVHALSPDRIFSYMTGIMSLNIPKFLKVINHKLLFKYGSVVITRNEFEGMVIY